MKNTGAVARTANRQNLKRCMKITWAVHYSSKYTTDRSNKWMENKKCSKSKTRSISSEERQEWQISMKKRRTFGVWQAIKAVEKMKYKMMHAIRDWE